MRGPPCILRAKLTPSLARKIIGTTAHLAAEAVLNRADVLLAIFCRWFDDCTFTYDGLQQRADGATFLLRFPAAAGLTYQFLAALLAGQQSGTHLRLAIYPDGAVGTASAARGQPGQGDDVCGERPPGAEGGASDDVAEMRLGSFLAPAAGREAWGARHGCATRVGPPEQPCSGSYRHFPGQSFELGDDFEWTCPFSALYILQITANCDVPCARPFGVSFLPGTDSVPLCAPPNARARAR